MKRRKNTVDSQQVVCLMHLPFPHKEKQLLHSTRSDRASAARATERVLLKKMGVGPPSSYPIAAQLAATSFGEVGQKENPKRDHRLLGLFFLLPIGFFMYPVFLTHNLIVCYVFSPRRDYNGSKTKKNDRIGIDVIKT